MYGFPRLYRKSQQLARWSIKDKPTLKLVSGRIGYAWRVPNTFAARWFGPAAAQATKRLVSSTAPVQAMVLLKTQSLLQPSFASSTIKRTAPAACSKSLLASTLKSGQHYFQQRGSSVPRVGMRSALRPLDTSLKTPAAAAALRRLGKPFNFVLGHSYRGQSSFACAAEARQ